MPIKAEDGRSAHWLGVATDITTPAVCGDGRITAPETCDDAGTILNVNADTVASELAVLLGAEAIVSLSDTSGVYQAQLTGTDGAQRVERFAVNVVPMQLNSIRLVAFPKPTCVETTLLMRVPAPELLVYVSRTSLDLGRTNR